MANFAIKLQAMKKGQSKKNAGKTRRNKQSGQGGNRSMWIAAVWLTVILCCVLFAAKQLGYCSTTDNSKAAKGEYDGIGNVITAPATDEVLVEYKGMTVSFNPWHHIPNWVAWELTRGEVNGDEPRAERFACDESVAGCPSPKDYLRSGYDRGHMAPAADMKWDTEAMEQSFYMTNICPQAKSLNTGAWKRLEEKCRLWAEIDSAIVIVCGPVITDKINKHIGDTRVAVPQRFFKVIASPYANPPRGIGFIMPNGKVPGGLQTCAVPIDSVEALTGHDFFSSLPDEMENDIEKQCKFHYWSTLKAK